MKIVKAIAIVILVAVVAALVAASVGAQPPTPAAPINPNWCSDVPASPPPPNFEHHRGDWTAIRQRCMNVGRRERGCALICADAEERWSQQKAGLLNRPDTFPPTTDKPQGPFPLPGGASGYILPAQPAPTGPIPATSGPQSSVLPPGPFSSFSGQELNALVFQPPDVSADVSPTQNAEFVNDLGLYVWTKPALPIPTPMAAPTTVISNNNFWCGSNGVNNQPLPGCVNNIETLGEFVDTQIGYDPWLGRWIATQMAADAVTGIGYLYFAASTTGTAGMSWNKWSVPTCTTNPSFPEIDQPLLGWSNSFVVVDVACAQSINKLTFGPDNLFVIPNSTITSPLQTLPGAISAPCAKMAPVRDNEGSFSNPYLLASIVPGSTIQANSPNCAPTSSNTAPYAVEYTANASGVFGSGGCAAGTSGCSPTSISPQWGHTPPKYNLGLASQQNCTVSTCEILLEDARITAAQIRPTNLSGTATPILAFGFATGVNAGSSGPQSQNLWFIQNVLSGSWLDHLNLAGGAYWYAYPTIAVDGDQDFYLGSTQLTAGTYLSTIWDAYTGIPVLTFAGQDYMEVSSGEYLGNPGQQPPEQSRWGDYNTMIYDPDAIPPGGEGSWWSVEEISNGPSDQSTTWVALADPTPQPYFVSYAYHEQECAVGSGQTCVATVNAPAGLQNGDVVIAALSMGGSFPKPPTPPDSTWVSIPIANQGNATSASQGSCGNGDLATEYVYAHVYGSSTETGSYKFKHVVFSFCSGVFSPEIESFLMGYRLANSNLASYVLYGYSDQVPASTVSVGPAPANAPVPGRLLNIFYGGGSETPESSEPNVNLNSVVSGSPQATLQTPALQMDYFLADVPIPVAGTSLNQYGIRTTTFPVTLFGWQLLVPK